jgi:hypothetical protein
MSDATGSSGSSGSAASGSASSGSASSIGDFYDADPRRRDSDEVEYGDAWTRHSDSNATYRLNHVLDTGELYVVREPHPGGILARFLDQLNVDQADVDQLTVEVLATVSAQEAPRLLDGWQDAMTGTDSLPWVERQLGRKTNS